MILVQRHLYIQEKKSSTKNKCMLRCAQLLSQAPDQGVQSDVPQCAKRNRVTRVYYNPLSKVKSNGSQYNNTSFSM
jgi:hypothetical protein